jgi:RNA polymerase subunit RPABC4/transcription elongation factor Spt4
MYCYFAGKVCHHCLNIKTTSSRWKCSASSLATYYYHCLIVIPVGFPLSMYCYFAGKVCHHCLSVITTSSCWQCTASSLATYYYHCLSVIPTGVLRWALMIQDILHPLSHVAWDVWGLGRLRLGMFRISDFLLLVFGMFCSWDVWYWGPWDVLFWEVLCWDVFRCIDILSFYYLYADGMGRLTMVWLYPGPGSA